MPSLSRIELLAPSPLNKYFDNISSTAPVVTFYIVTCTGSSVPGYCVSTLKSESLWIRTPWPSRSHIKTSSMSPWCSVVVKGYRAWINSGQLDPRSCPVYTKAWRVRIPESNVSKWPRLLGPWSRPSDPCCTTGQASEAEFHPHGQLLLLEVWYQCAWSWTPHLARQAHKSNPVGPAPTTTVSYMAYDPGITAFCCFHHSINICGLSGFGEIALWTFGQLNPEESIQVSGMLSPPTQSWDQR